jgi:excinuclease ABC subunit A
VAQGTVADIAACTESETGRYLREAMRHPLQARRAVNLVAEPPTLHIHDAHLHNL